MERVDMADLYRIKVGELLVMSRKHAAAMKHVRRLLEQNRELAEAVAEERLMRKAAWREYWKRQQNTFINTILAMARLMKSESAQKAEFYQDSYRKL